MNCRRVLAVMAAATLPLSMAAPAHAAQERDFSGELVSINTRANMVVVRASDGTLERAKYRDADALGFFFLFDYYRDDLEEGDYDCDVRDDTGLDIPGNGDPEQFEEIVAAALEGDAESDLRVSIVSNKDKKQLGAYSTFYVYVNSCDGVIEEVDDYAATIFM